MRVRVETNLDELVEHGDDGLPRQSYRRHARTRFMKPEASEAKPHRSPEVGDPWEPLTVRARLQRFGEAWRKVPHTPDTKPTGYRSCMPEPVRELFKDLPGEPMRIPVAKADYAAAMQLLDSLITFADTSERIVWWALAVKLPDRALARHLHCSHPHAAKRKEELLAKLTVDWNRRGWSPEEADVARARQMIHRNI